MFKVKTKFLFIFFFLSFALNAYANSPTWQPLNDGVVNTGTITEIAVNPKNNDEIYTESRLSGLFKSTDHGKTWESVGQDIFVGKRISQIIYHPAHANEIYVCTNNGVYKTKDNAVSWQQINRSTDATLTFNPVNTNEIYLVDETLSFKSKIILKSIDSGESWNAIKIPDSNDIENFWNLSIQPNQPNILFLTGLIKDTWHGVILKSVDCGKTWQRLADLDETYDPRKIIFSPENPNILYLEGENFCKSVDGGIIWQPLLKADEDYDRVFSVNINPADPKEMYVAFLFKGFYKTEDGGVTWIRVNDFFRSDVQIEGVAFNPNDAKELYAGVDSNGLFYSQDGGVTWTQKSAGLIGLNVTTIVADPLHPNIKYAGTDGNGLWITHDSNTWELMNTPFTKGKIHKIVINPINPAILFLVYQDYSSGTLLYRSTDYGKTWVETPVKGDPHGQDSIPQVAINPTNPNEVYALPNADYDGLIMKSTDGGATWSNYSFIKSDLVFPRFGLIINPKNPNEMYVGGTLSGSDDGWHPHHGHLVFKSLDAGKTWAPASDQFPDWLETMRAMTVDAAHPTTLYLATSVSDGTSYIKQAHLYKTENGGKTWKLIEAGLPPKVSISTIVIDPNDSQKLYISLSNTDYFDIGAGVYVSNDGGASWKPFNDGLYNPIVTTLELTQGKLYLGTAGSGFFVADDLSIGKAKTS